MPKISENAIEIAKKILTIFSSFKLYFFAFTLGAAFAGGSIFYITNRNSSEVIDGMREEIKSLNRSLVELGDNNKQLEFTKGQLDSTNRELTNQLGRRQETIDSLVRTNSNLERTNSSLTQSSIARQKFIDEIAKSVGNLDTGISNAKDDISRLKEYIRFATNTLSAVRNILQSPTGTK